MLTLRSKTQAKTASKPSNLLDSDWPSEEEQALVRKLDMRILTSSFVIFILAYLDRGNIGSIRVLQYGGPDSLEKSLHLKGTDFNWVTILKSGRRVELANTGRLSQPLTS